MKASTKRITSIGLAGIFLIGALVVYTNLIRPVAEDITQERAGVLSKETLFHNQKSAVEQVQSLIGQFQGYVKLQETVRLAMPLEENTTQILNQVHAMARNSQSNIEALTLKPLSYEPSRQPLAKRLGTIEINATVKGSYDAVKNFMRFLETNVRIANIKQFKISPVGSGTGVAQDLFALSLTAEVYYQES